MKTIYQKTRETINSRIVMASAIVLAASLQGCGSGSSHVKAIADSAPSTTSIALSGTAVKGVVVNADCIIYDADRTTVLYSSVNESSACTDANGNYSVTLSTQPSGPVIVELVPRGIETTMLCDFPDGCGSEVAFGQSLNLGSDFKLRAVVPEVNGSTVEANVTPWSEVAAARAINAAGTGSITTTQAEESVLEVVAVLNNILGLEGTDSAFDDTLLSIDPVNLVSPTAVDTGEDTKGSLLSLASSSLFDLIDTSDNTSIEAVITNLAAAFEEDGEFNVNDTATNTGSDNGIDLADILTGVAEVAKGLPTVLQESQVTVLQDLLDPDDSQGLTLTSLSDEAETLSEEKNNVTNQALDPTKPLDVDTTTSSLDKTKQLALDIENMLASGYVAFAEFDDNSTSPTIYQQLDELFETSTTDVVDEIENLTDLIQAAHEMLLAAVNTSSLTDIGCTDESGVVTCNLNQLASLIDNDYSMVLSGSGSLILNTTLPTISVSASSVMIGNSEYLLTLEAGSTASTQTLAVASIDIGNNDVTNISLGSSSTISGTENISFTVDANDIVINLPDEYSFAGDLMLTRDLTIRDTVLSSFNFDGQFTTMQPNTQSSTADATLVFETSTATLNSEAATPTFGEGPDESATNFYTVNNAVFTTEVPVSYNKATLVPSTQQTSIAQRDTANETIRLRISGDRTALGVTNLGVRYSFIGSESVRTISGSVVLSDGQEVYTLSNGVAVATVTVIDGSFSASLTVNGVATGNISSAGLVEFEEDATFMQLVTWLPTSTQ